MGAQRNMTPTARRFSRTLIAKFPRFKSRLRILPSGDFEAHITAPRGSKAGAVVVQSDGMNVWVRFALPRAFYHIESTRELVHSHRMDFRSFRVSRG